MTKLRDTAARLSIDLATHVRRALARAWWRVAARVVRVAHPTNASGNNRSMR